MSHKCKAYSRWQSEKAGRYGTLYREAFYAGWQAGMERAIELLADQYGYKIEAATMLVREAVKGQP